MSELRECPWPECKFPHTTLNKRPHPAGFGSRFYVCCNKCTARGPSAPSPEEAARLWNTRKVPDVWPAVDAIVDNLTSRRGLRQAWEGFDLETQDEIRNAWEECVRSALGKSTEGE